MEYIFIIFFHLGLAKKENPPVGELSKCSGMQSPLFGSSWGVRERDKLFLYVSRVQYVYNEQVC